MTCVCGIKYVGKTKRELRRRIGEHVSDIIKRKDTPIARHVETCHDGEVTSVRFQGIEHVRASPRGGDLDVRLLQKEARWIFMLDTIKPMGLNDAICYTSFI